MIDLVVFFSSRRRHTIYWRDWSSDVCSSDLPGASATSTPEPRPLVVGLSAALSGPSAPAGEALRRGLSLAIGDRESVGLGKSVDLGGRRLTKKKKSTPRHQKDIHDRTVYTRS